ncbi:MAG: 50S ribosomal protein L29 [Leptolyngbyaceae cyanobacterium bins.349]|nr:50S ribosomal protein L29 [Leptolyngbyaceae cyanobacterium bins.349]
MALPKIDEIRSLSDQDIEAQIIEVKKQLFELRFQKGTRRLEKPHQFKHNRHRLAQLMTVERERQLQKSAEG